MAEASTIAFRNYNVYLHQAGHGQDLVLIHGIGPGTSIPANFDTVFHRLAQNFRVTGIDLIGFGGSSRKIESPYFDVALWIDQVSHVLDVLGFDRVALLGHSAGGAIALKVASQNRRVTEVISSAGVGSSLVVNAYLDRFWRVPENIAELREMVSGTFFHASQIADEALQSRLKNLQDKDLAAYLRKMFEGDKQLLMNKLIVADKEWERIQARLLFLHGREDRPCPVEETALQLWSKKNNADLIVLANCGHSIPREAPTRFVRAVEEFLLLEK